MLNLPRVYPYNLNDRVGDEYKKEETHQLVLNVFLKRRNRMRKMKITGVTAKYK